MGNIFGGGRKMAQVMKVDGETMKFKTPMRVGDIVKDYPGYVLMDSEAVKHHGIRTKPLESQQEIKPRRIYFLIELPSLPAPVEEKVPRRVRSGIQMSAKDRLENLMLSRRCSSDLTVLKASNLMHDGEDEKRGTVRVRMRLPKAQVAKLVEESTNSTEAAEKIVDLCLVGNTSNITPPKENDGEFHQQSQWKPGLGSIKETFKTNQKRVVFSTIKEGDFIH